MPEHCTAPLTDQSRCPLCQAPNSCAVADASDAGSCWCQLSPIEPSAIIAAARLDAAQRCICQHCARQVQQLSRKV